ncbi:hypothetical protein Tco_0546023 [Tanacetum coccineum]
MSLTLWNDEVQAVVDRSSYQLCDKYAKVDYNDQLPIEITSLIEADDVRRNNALLLEKLEREDTDKIVVRIEQQLARDHGQFARLLEYCDRLKTIQTNLPL